MYSMNKVFSMTDSVNQMVYSYTQDDLLKVMLLKGIYLESSLSDYTYSITSGKVYYISGLQCFRFNYSIRSYKMMAGSQFMLLGKDLFRLIREVKLDRLC